MTRMKTLAIRTHALLVFAWLGLAAPHGLTAVEPQTSQKPAASAAKPATTADALDRLLAPIALYPDQLLAQMLLCASNPGKVATLGEWLASQTLKGTELQDAATKAGFEPSFVALVLFPQVVEAMAGDVDWTTRLGQAFTADRSAVFASIQRLRVKAQQAGKLKTTPQQEVETRTTSSGQQVVVIEPANPQVVYVPQYNPQTVYTTTSSSTVVVQQESSSGSAVAAGVIGFTAGIAIGAAMDNDYYYGPYGWRGGGYMYDDAWDDWDDAREDARDDWQDHRGGPAESAATARATRRNSAANGSRAASRNAPKPSRRGSKRIRRRRRSATRGERKRRRQPGKAGPPERARRPAATAATRTERRGTEAARNPMRFRAIRAENRSAPPASADKAAGAAARGGGRRR